MKKLLLVPCILFGLSSLAMAQSQKSTSKKEKEVTRCVEKKMNDRSTFDKVVDRVVPNVERVREKTFENNCTRDVIFKDKEVKGKNEPN